MPEALQLAAIQPFWVFVTTTLDPLLADTLAARRAILTVVVCARAAPPFLEFRTARIAIDPRDPERASGSRRRPPSSQASSTPNYVVTEEDASSRPFASRRPEGLFDLLAQMKLLIRLPLPELAGALLPRTSRRRRLLQSLDRTDFVKVDPRVRGRLAGAVPAEISRPRPRFTSFYRPTEFVDEPIGDGPAGCEPAAMRRPIFTPCSIFISMRARTPAAANIAEQIRAANLPVWLDRGRLGSGDDWGRKIRRNIEVAAAFVPVLSKSCLVAGSREFRREWRYAYQVKAGLPQNADFIMPLGIDDLPRGSEEIDEELRALDWDARDPQGTLPAAFIKRLRDAFRRARSGASGRRRHVPPSTTPSAPRAVDRDNPGPGWRRSKKAIGNSSRGATMRSPPCSG